MNTTRDLIRLIKQIAIEVVESHHPMKVVYGEVISNTPIKIKVEQKIVLDESFLILTNNVLNHTIQMVTDGKTKSVTRLNGLEKGEKVIMLRQQEGQKYIVIDKLK